MADQLPPLANVRELAAITGRDVGDQNLVAALRAASNRFRGRTNHSVSLVTETGAEFDGSGGPSLNLRAIPIVSVAAVRVDGVTLDPTTYRVSKRSGYLRLRRGIFPALPGIVEVDYSHGYDATAPADDATDPSLPGVPGDIQAAVLELAQIMLEVTPGVQSRTVLGDQVVFGAAATVGATQQWVDAVNAYRVAAGDEA